MLLLAGRWKLSIYEDGLLVKGKCRFCLLLVAALPALAAESEVSYIGNKACAGCHADIYRRYAATPMANSSGRNLQPLTPGSFLHSASQVRYEIDRKGEVKISRGTARDVRRLSYYFGSGAAGLADLLGTFHGAGAGIALIEH